jgi:Domain of unknown function (DUF6265)
MKNLILVVIFLSSQLAIAQVDTDLKKLSWLEGKWERVNTKPGKTGFEVWTKISSSEWKGMGVSLNGADTAFVEKLRLIVQDGTPYYVADVPQNQDEVRFRISELTATGFVCENPAHDFPKKISYQRDGDKLKATISGNGKSIDYLFVKR